MTIRDKRHTSTDRPLWVHLGTRHDDVIALAISQHGGMWRELLRRGWAQDDLRQELLVRVLAKQSLPRSRYDGDRAGLPKYLVTVTGSELWHLLESADTLKATSEELGATMTVDGESVEVDAALVAEGDLRPALSDEAEERLAEEQEAEIERERAARKPKRRAR